ncbi:hypothetical protein V6N13_024648 [Hibiscus sabdariffa]|uniref:Uncharacterized protein n=1 Tax=Hibiscus sabdariffa TaxID=183260 RepID=A0ABR1ZVL8_9ROSI
MHSSYALAATSLAVGDNTVAAQGTSDEQVHAVQAGDSAVATSFSGTPIALPDVGHSSVLPKTSHEENGSPAAAEIEDVGILLQDNA